MDGEGSALKLRRNYADAVLEAGGVPMLLPLSSRPEVLEEAARVCGGFLFSGGDDIHPRYFGEDMLQCCGAVELPRDEMELALLRIALRDDKPVLGICRGIQTLNVGLGGSLYQDLREQTGTRLCHQQKPPYSFGVHKVVLEEDSLLYRIVGKRELQVNSMHHQAVRDLAPSLRAAAVSADGLVECLWRPESRFFLGVQWHPEYLRPADEDAAALFRAFVQAAGQDISQPEDEEHAHIG